MVVLSREAFDTIEFDAAYTGDYRAAAEQMTRLADTATPSVALPRSEAYLRAGDQWLLADNPAAAANSFLRALADGGPTSIDPRAPLVRALFLLGQADEAEAHIRDLGLAVPRDPRLCDLLSELLVERSELERALAWATAGVDLCLGRQPGPIVAPAPWPEAAAGGRAPAADDPNPEEEPHTGGGRAGGDALRPGRGRPDSPAGPAGQRPVLPSGDRTELRLLLTLRYRIRNDLGLGEDAYDQLLDELLSEAGGPPPPD